MVGQRAIVHCTVSEYTYQQIKFHDYVTDRYLTLPQAMGMKHCYARQKIIPYCSDLAALNEQVN